MPSVVQTQTINSIEYMLKDRPNGPIVASFTAVNGRTSPSSPRKLNSANGMPTESVHVRPISQHHTEPPTQTRSLLPGRESWAPVARPFEHGGQNGHHSVSPPASSDEEKSGSPHSTVKRKRSSSAEDDSSQSSPEGAPVQARRRIHPHLTANTYSQVQHISMEQPQTRTLPPIERAEYDRHWSSRDAHPLSPTRWESRPRALSPNGVRSHDPRAMEHSQDPDSTSPTNGMMDSQHTLDPSTGATEITRAGVQVDPKKRKRQFANRTKTGCGTCRRRKKKCDEAKPECNNCVRGGFICEGYAHKVPWPKNSVMKSHPPLQAKDNQPMEPAQLYHTHGTTREGYSEPVPSDGGRGRPIMVEEPDRQTPARNGWGNWPSQPRTSYTAEPSQPPEYAHARPPVAHDRPPPVDPHATHPGSAPPAQRQHNPRIYHHTPQTMSQVVNSSPAVSAEAQMHHHGPPLHHVAAPGPPPPPPSHGYAPQPPRHQKTEREKMLNGEPYLPYSSELLLERDKCKGVVYQFNQTNNPNVQISGDEQHRLFKAIVFAKGIMPYRSGPESAAAGHVGHDVHVDAPFHADYGYNLVIHDMVTMGPNCKLLDSGRITIGRNTRVSADVTIDTQKVPTDSKSVKGSRGTVIAAEVTIGENVYIGPNVTICAGVKIGNGAIIHPGSVVLKDVPRDCVARGNPANVQAVNWED